MLNKIKKFIIISKDMKKKIVRKLMEILIYL